MIPLLNGALTPSFLNLLLLLLFSAFLFFKIFCFTFVGNCKTVMVATINPEGTHTDESISTCRFAQRVALIENKAVLNEEVRSFVIHLKNMLGCVTV